MGDASGFQLAMILVGALFAIINLFIGIMIKHMLDEQRSQREILRDIESQYYPRDEFQRYEDNCRNDRHEVKTRLTALEIRLGDWKMP